LTKNTPFDVVEWITLYFHINGLSVRKKLHVTWKRFWQRIYFLFRSYKVAHFGKRNAGRRQDASYSADKKA